ncbi:hypothetical protein ACSBR2_013916 [Camellia fascicularis]
MKLGHFECFQSFASSPPSLALFLPIARVTLSLSLARVTLSLPTGNKTLASISIQFVPCSASALRHQFRCLATLDLQSRYDLCSSNFFFLFPQKAERERESRERKIRHLKEREKRCGKVKDLSDGGLID